MSKVAVQSIPAVVATSAPLQPTSSAVTPLGDEQGVNVVFDAIKLRCLPGTAANSYVCLPQTNAVQTAYPVLPGLITSMAPSFVSALMVIVGWYVVSKAQSNRERRKQIREYVSKLRDDLEVLEALTIGYHTATREEVKEQEIISKLGRFEKDCSTLPRFLQSQKYFKALPPVKLIVDGQCLQILRKAMTLSHFGDEHTGALSRQDEKILNLELAAWEMQEALERVRIDSLD